MKKVTITEFKDDLSSLLAKAAEGEEILILDRKKPYVRVVALFQYSQDRRDAKAGDTEERLQGLEARALVSRRKLNTLSSLLKRPRPKPRASVVDALVEERNREP